MCVCAKSRLGTLRKENKQGRAARMCARAKSRPGTLAKQYKSEQIEEAMLHKMKERGLKLWWPGASPLEAQAQLPTFFDLYTEMFGCCHDGTNGMQNMIDRNVRPLFEKLVSNEAGEIFKLPQMTELEPAVWEHLERAIKGDPTTTRCRACHTKFNAKHGEQVCSNKCKEKHKATQKGFTCHVCSKSCVRQNFYDPATDSYYRTQLLDKYEEELNTLLCGKPDMAKALITTKRQQNPIIFCSDKCEQAHFREVVCISCGNTDATIKPFPNIDAVLQLNRCVERCGARDELLSRCADDWQLKDTCKSCGSAMMPRKLDLAPAPFSLRATYCRA